MSEIFSCGTEWSGSGVGVEWSIFLGTEWSGSGVVIFLGTEW